jgi:hypothetical protein
MAVWKRLKLHRDCCSNEEKVRSEELAGCRRKVKRERIKE